MAGQPLDSIIRKDMVGSKSNGTVSFETINSTDFSSGFDISGSEGGYLINIQYDNGVSANIEFNVEASIDNVNYGPVPDTDVVITDTDGNITYEIVNSIANFVRISWTVTSGSLDIYAQLSAKRRH